jgi:hypothetical protein
MRRIFVFAVSVLSFVLANGQDGTDPGDLFVLKNNWIQYSNAPNSLYLHMAAEARVLAQERQNTIKNIHGPAEWKSRQKWVRETLIDILGPFPDKTPLNARIVRTIKKEGYRVEHIIFESQPHFYVTSSLFIPDGLKKPAPAVIYVSGHSNDGYRSPVYQHIMLNLVKKGFVVFAFDPIGQGERLEYFNEKTGKSEIGIGTSEHSYAGVQAFMTGSSQARYFTWDGIRAIDYLVTRKEVDPTRIGMTGRSGGGTQTAYIAAVDDRVTAAAPENWITSYSRVFQSIMPQDAEQNLYKSLFRGIDHGDLLLARAPKPLLLLTTSRDFFSIQGVRETEKEVAQFYEELGKPENCSRSEDDTVHASTIKNREAMYAFFQEYLKNPGDPADVETRILSVDEMRVTPDGQVSTSLQSETVFSLNAKEVIKLTDQLESSRNDADTHVAGLKEAAMKLSGFRKPSRTDDPVFTGRYNREGYSVEKYFVRGEGDYVFPFLLFVPQKPGGKAMIYLHPSGKSAEAAPGKEIEWFTSQGITVLVPDLVGIGETGPGSYDGEIYSGGSPYSWSFASLHIGRSIAGIQAGDVVRLTMILGKRPGISKIFGFARREMAPVLLHAAAFNDKISRIALVEPVTSYRSVAMSRFYDNSFTWSFVPGALTAYDLPDMAACLAPRSLLIYGAVDGTGKAADAETIEKDTQFIKSFYHRKNASDKIVIEAGDTTGEKLRSFCLDWIK